MAPKINIVAIYQEILANIQACTPEFFEEKIARLPEPKKTKKNWLKANDFELLGKAISHQNNLLAIYLFNELQNLALTFLRFDNYHHLSMAFCQTNQLIFNYLFQHLPVLERESFFTIRGLFLFKFALENNAIKHVDKLFEIDATGVGTYIRYRTFESLLKVIKSLHSRFFEIYFSHLNEVQRLACLKENESVLIKNCIKYSRIDILTLIFQFEPAFFQKLNSKEMTALFEWIALEASPKLFHFMEGFINPKYIEKTYTLVSKDFFKKLHQKNHYHVLEYLMVAAPEIKLFDFCYEYLSVYEGPSCKAILKTYKPLRQLYQFLISLIDNQAEAPDDLDLLKLCFDTFNQEQKLLLIQNQIFHEVFPLNLQKIFKPVFMAIAAKKVRLFELDENHPIHPFFPVITKFYYPIALEILKKNLKTAGKLLYFSLNLVSELHEVSHESLRAFPEFPYFNFTSILITNLVHQKNHVMYQELSPKNTMMFLGMLMTIGESQTEEFKKIFSANKTLTFQYPIHLRKTSQVALQPVEWLWVMSRLQMPYHFNNLQQFKHFIQQNERPIIVEYTSNLQFS